jgi:hypothetical protein
MLKQYQNIVRACFFTPLADADAWGIPFNLIGDPGVSKTSVVKAFAREFGVPYIIKNPSVDGEGAFGVTPCPMPNKKGEMRLTYPPPEYADDFEGGRGLVIIDEANSHPGLFGAVMAMVQEGRVGSYTFPGGVRRGCTMNPPERSANGAEPPIPFANRNCNLEFKAPSVTEHIEYMMSLQAGKLVQATPLDCAAEEERVMKAWANEFARAVGLETSFLKAHPSLKNKDLGKPDPNNTRGWYSDRSCEAAARFIASAKIQRLTEEETEMGLTGLTGPEWTESFLTFQQHADMPDICDFLDKKIQWKHMPNRADRTMAVLNSSLALLQDRNLKDWATRVGNLWDYMADIGKESKDLLVDPVLVLSKMCTQNMKQAQPVVNIMGNLFKNLNAGK